MAVVFFAAIGSGAALAQGCPPGSGPWHSGWGGFAESAPGQATSTRKEGATHSDGRGMTVRDNASVPVAGKAQDTARKS